MKKISFVFFFAFLLISCQSEKVERALIDDFSFNIPLVNDINDLFGQPGKIIQLDTVTEALVGRIGKLIKHENHFYILSDDRRILHFDNTGKFISSLDKRGGGPDEYTRIGDFSLFKNNGNTELWICDFNRIRKYVLSGHVWNLIGTIDFKFVIHKFKIIPDDHILFVTGQNKESLMLSDINGKSLRSFLKKEIPFLIFKAVQFTNYDSSVIFQLGVSNEGVALNTENLTFEHIYIVNNKHFLTSKNLLDLFNRLGQDYLRELPNTTYIGGFCEINGNICLHYKYNGEFFIAVRRHGVWKKIKYDSENYFSIATLFGSESNDSFIFYEYPEDDNLNLILHEF